MKTTPKKVFILENGKYIEITYQQHQERMAMDKQYRGAEFYSNGS